MSGKNEHDPKHDRQGNPSRQIREDGVLTSEDWMTHPYVAGLAQFSISILPIMQLPVIIRVATAWSDMDLGTVLSS
jgi:hypothetical protein